MNAWLDGGLTRVRGVGTVWTGTVGVHSGAVCTFPAGSILLRSVVTERQQSRQLSADLHNKTELHMKLDLTCRLFLSFFLVNLLLFVQVFHFYPKMYTLACLCRLEWYWRTLVNEAKLMCKEHSSNSGEAAALQEEDCSKGTTFPSMQGKQRFEQRVEIPVLGLTLRRKIPVSCYIVRGKTDTFSPFLPTSNCIDPPDSAFPRRISDVFPKAIVNGNLGANVKEKKVEFYILDFSKTITNLFSTSEMCILGWLIDVENVIAICKKKKKKSKELFPCQRLSMYIFDGLRFQGSWLFCSFMQYGRFCAWRRASCWVINKAGSFIPPCMFYKDLRGYPAGIFMERFFTTLFCIEYATKLY